MAMTNALVVHPFKPSETTGYTPPNFFPPPADKPEYHPYRLPKDDQYDDWINRVEFETGRF